jgi:hypothetical protein
MVAFAAGQERDASIRDQQRRLQVISSIVLSQALEKQTTQLCLNQRDKFRLSLGTTRPKLDKILRDLCPFG